MKRAAYILITILSIMHIKASGESLNIKIVETSDVHGNFFPYNFITRQPWSGSLARAATYIDSLRKTDGNESVILLDNGDFLQGQPTVYYYNFIDTVTPHIASRIYDYLGYDAATIGNHDVETGHEVYDRVIRTAPMPMLGANIIDTASGNPYLKPYCIIERQGIKIAVLGLITPAIPAWLPNTLWSGLRFDDMELTARKWMNEIKQTEKPDIVVGLFHSGHDVDKKTAEFIENASLSVARNVPGFDVVMMGHDHRRYNSKLLNAAGDSVLVVNPANNANAVALANISIKFDDNGAISKSITGEIVDISNIAPDEKYLAHFSKQFDAVEKFVSRKIGSANGTFSTHDAFFGPSAFIDLIHNLQLEITGADISMAAPLSFDAIISKGDICVSDMFNLYKYENQLYTMELTGQEIKDYLEESYGIWTRQMNSADEHMLLFADENPTPKHNALENPSYSFDSAAGIDYTVDLTKPKGEKVTIRQMSDGKPFVPGKKYKVAINSYRGNGGGDLLTKGAGIPREQLKSRILASTDKDLRYYLMKTIESKKVITPKVNGNWKFIPDDYVKKASARDREILFPNQNARNAK